jgi:acetate kinase
MRILAVNAGSSSLKLSVVDDGDRVQDAHETDGDADPIAALRDFAARVGDVDAVAHRLVHGGASIRHAVIVDDAVRHQLDAAVELAPLHVPPALALLDAARASIDRPQIVCVDTAFHAAIPEFATTYAIPGHWRDWGVRRYGFHGLSYAWSSRRSAELLQRPAEKLHVVIAHIGSGVSACAVRDGRSVDTSMGFTPLEGAVMASRSGTVDPGALLWLQESHGITVGAMTRLLEHGSGLFGLCGMSDIRDVEREAALGNQACVLALDVYIHVLVRVIGGLATRWCSPEGSASTPRWSAAASALASTSSGSRTPFCPPTETQSSRRGMAGLRSSSSLHARTRRWRARRAGCSPPRLRPAR